MPDSSPVSQRPRITLLISLLIFTTTLGVYFSAWDYPFISLDDHLYVMENAHVRLGLSLKSLNWAFTEAYRHANYWIPLTWVSFLFDWELYGTWAGGYHLTNVLLHALNSVLLFLWLHKSTRMRWRSAVCALLFALHPLHVESVAWVTERKDVLSTFFWMLGLWSYSGYVEKPGVFNYAAVLVSFCCGLMAKPMVVTFPFVLLLLDFWPLQRTALQKKELEGSRHPKIIYRLLKEKIPMLAISFVAVVVVWQTQEKGGAIVSLMSLPLEMRVRAVPVFYVGYLYKMLWPFDLALVYPYPPVTPLWKTMASVTALLGITYIAFRWRRSRTYLGVGWLWYLGTLLPVIGLVAIGPQGMADRYTYIPLIGIYFAVVWGLSDIHIFSRRMRSLATGCVVLVFSALAVLTIKQIGYWQGSKTLYEHTLATTENNWFVHNLLGMEYEKAGDLIGAEKQFSAALGIISDYPGALLNLGRVQRKMGRPEAALASYQRALLNHPDHAKLHNNMGNLLVALGRLEEAIAHYQKALNTKPDYAMAHYNLGSALEKQGRLVDAVGHYLEAIRLDPLLLMAYNNMAIAMYRLGDTARAVEVLKEALSIDPGFQKGRRNLEWMQKQ